jgi:hypothetical protein
VLRPGGQLPAKRRCVANHASCASLGGQQRSDSTTTSRKRYIIISNTHGAMNKGDPGTNTWVRTRSRRQASGCQSHSTNADPYHPPCTSASVLHILYSSSLPLQTIPQPRWRYRIMRPLIFAQMVQNRDGSRLRHRKEAHVASFRCSIAAEAETTKVLDT